MRVLTAGKPKIINTRRGPRTISEAVVGDKTGRVKLTLWGKHAGSIKEGEAIEIKDAWSTSYRGEVQLNLGVKGTIRKLGDEEAPQASDIPDNYPKASSETPRRTPYRRFGPGRR
ncbi:MAG: single-stranded DNA-binding protein [Desulfurococcales archaeon]|nr:single-stranded DNA-binding protein [Desulfurococcales archaeon]